MSKFSSTAAIRAGLMSLIGVLLFLLAGRAHATPIVEFPIPSIGAIPEGLTYGPDGAYWFVEFYWGRVGRIDTNGAITEYVIPSTTFAEPVGIVTDPDSNLWFTESKADRLGRITTNGTITEFPLPVGVVPQLIALGADGRLWVTDNGVSPEPNGATTNGGILAVTIGTNGIVNTSYYNSNFTVGGRPKSIISAPNGNLYFVEEHVGKIGSITTNGVISETAPLATNSFPFDLTLGPDGAIWFTENGSNKLGRVDTSLTTVTEYALPTNGITFTGDGPLAILLGPDGNLWYSDSVASLVTRIGFSGTNISFVTNTTFTTNVVGNTTTVTTNVSTNLNSAQFLTPTLNSFPRRLATGADGNIWFGEFVGNQQGFVDNIAKFIMPVPLSIQLITGPQVVLSWTTNITTNFVLQTNSDLTTTNWGFATNVPTIVTNRYVVTNPATGNLFFRLID